MANTTYKDDQIIVLGNEFQEIQECIGMYISYDETMGAMHLFKEIFNNSTDECINRDSPGDTIQIIFDEMTMQSVIEDNGRGIPFDMMEDTCTKKHSSSKFKSKRSANKLLSGMNGVGQTVTVALSDYFALTCFREGQSKTIEFQDCVMQKPIIKKLTKQDPPHGTRVSMIPSQKYLGKIELTCDHILDWLRRMSYILPSKEITGKELTIHFLGKPMHIEKEIVRTFTRVGIAANVEYLSPSLEFSPLTFVVSSDEFDLEMAFSYDKTMDGILNDSYCNMIHTVENGYHVTACERAICEFFSKQAKVLDPNAKYDVTFDDCRKGLIFAVNCRHMNPKLSGQVKSKLDNKDVLEDGKKLLYLAMDKYFSRNQAELRKIVAYLRIIAKARMEVNKVKGVSTKKPMTFLEDAEIKGFHNIEDRHWKGYTELIISEGDSAGDHVDKVRNRKYQAVFSIFGVIDNVYDKPIEALLAKKNAVYDFIKILGCGIGKEFNINKLRWNKIILMQDADCDGLNICSLLSSFIAKYLPEIILEGRLYRAVPPLYTIKKGKRGIEEYIYDKNDYFERLIEMIAANEELMIKYPNGDTEELSKSRRVKWLYMNKNYQELLINLSKRTACSKYILEHVCYFALQTNGNEPMLKKKIETKFPEITYNIEEHSMFGSYNGEFVSLIVDKIFIKLASPLMDLMAQNPSVYVYARNKGESGYMKMTIGEFYDRTEILYIIEIEQRYKGLGQVPEYNLFESSINPEKRYLIKLKMDDVESTMKTFEILHGKSMIEERRNLLANAHITYDDIDS